jgi:hypothetical protein
MRPSLTWICRRCREVQGEINGRVVGCAAAAAAAAAVVVVVVVVAAVAQGDDYVVVGATMTMLAYLQSGDAKDVGVGGGGKERAK